MKKTELAVQTGHAIRIQRSARKFSQESFADHIDMHRAYYSAIERGEKNITLATLQRIAAGLGISMSDLLVGVGASRRRK